MKKDDIIITYGTHISRMVRMVLDKAELALSIPKHARIGIKPNLVVAKTHDSGATTSPLMVEALIQYLQEHGFYDIIILEGSWIGDDTKRAFSISGIENVAEKYKVPLLDTKDDTYCKIQAGPIEMEISKTALDLDFIITMPVLKGHCQTKITGALKNFKGCLSDKEKRHFHTLGLHRPIAYLNTVLHPGFILMDGLCGDLDFEEGGNPVPMNRIVAGLDPVLIDSYAASAMGYEPGEIGYIKMAAELGVGSMDLKHANLIVLEKDTCPVKMIRSRKVQALAKAVTEKNACSACYANLIQALARLEERGLLSYYKKHPVCIGQTFRDQSGNSLGIGSCTCGFIHSVPGCPPATADILKGLLTGLNAK